jgi:sRNA-binding regulator protein Hfq
MNRHRRRRFTPNKSRDGIANMIFRASRVEDQTNAEAAYLAQLIQNRTPVTVKLMNDQEISGWIEYYDKNFIRITRADGPNAFIFKDQIKFIVDSK